MTDYSYLTPTTELMAVNSMLRSIGEAPVETLTDSTVEDAGMALDALRSLSRAIQTIGWHWNTDEDLVIEPDTTGNLSLPLNTLKVSLSDLDRYNGWDVTWRGTRLYDRKNHTYTFPQSLRVNLVQMLQFEEMPEAARQYVFVAGGAVFQQGAIGSVQLDHFSEKNVKQALLAVEAAEAEESKYNILTGNWSAFRIIQRMVPP